jgi:molybdopterin/thiamine biosynthesis adenylyltransferase
MTNQATSAADMPADEFYAEFTKRNRGLITPEDQQRLRSARILVAGCGSVGGAVVEPFVRFGAEHLSLAEPDEYDLANLNRQNARLQDIGRNKAEVFQERVREINPFAEVDVHHDGITDQNVAHLVKAADIVIDGVDVTTKPPLRAKYRLHQQARREKVPVISGYDVAGLQLLHIYDYRDPKVKVLNGKVRASELDEMEPMTFLQRVIPIAAIPNEIIEELHRQLRGESAGFPQIVYTANLFGVLALPAALEILAGRPVQRRIILDVPTLLRPPKARAATFGQRLRRLYGLNNAVRRQKRAMGG